MNWGHRGTDTEGTQNSSMLFPIKVRATKFSAVTQLHRRSRYYQSCEVIQNQNPCERWFAKVVCTLFCFQSHCLDLHSDYLGKGLTPLIAFEVVRRLDNHTNDDNVRNPDLALRFFAFSRVSLRVIHTVGSYNYMLRSLCQMGLHDSANSVLDWMMLDGHHLGPSLCGFLVGSFAEAGRWDIARKLLERAECKEMGTSSFVYNKFLSVLVRQHRIDEAVSFFRECMASKSCSDTCTFNILIKGLCRARQVDKAFRFFEDMSSFGLFPDVITYNIIIDGLCKANEVHKAQELLREVRSRNDISPDVITYTSIISSLCKLGKMEEASLLLHEMISAGIRPTIVSFNTLIDGFGKVGDMESVSDMYEKMLFMGCYPDVVTFTSRIDGYCRIGQVDEALGLLREMIHRNLSPNEYTFSILINALCKENRIKEACDFLENLKLRKIIPEPFMYNPIIDGLCKSGNVDKANLIVSQMGERGSKPDKYTFTMLIIGHCMKGRMLEAINIFKKMLAVKCTPDDITIKSLVSCLVKAGMTHEAWNIKKHIVLEKVELDSSSSGRSIPVRSKPITQSCPFMYFLFKFSNGAPVLCFTVIYMRNMKMRFPGFASPKCTANQGYKGSFKVQLAGVFFVVETLYSGEWEYLVADEVVQKFCIQMSFLTSSNSSCFDIWRQAARLIAQLIVMGSGILIRAVAQAYRQALASNASSSFLIVAIYT
ncbi:hypothetical protein Cgig2_033716 [Carnegiea gigantea]|uniref:Pentatricopeptide repeat-containing protein n=1 Tax=Carnegiea gigantea TaxID=171969 RepID=A0A9Q1QD89_9CARY|nr:hypothetical protein Cgig2_033716 [Carnegiea gigantea]